MPALWPSASGWARTSRPGSVSLVLITDPGPDPDVVKALLVSAVLHLQQGPAQLAAVIANGGGQPRKRARLARCILDHIGLHDVAVGVGSEGRAYVAKPHEYSIEGYERTDDTRLRDGSALLVELLRAASPKSITFVCTSSLRDLADLMRASPDLVVDRVRFVSIVGGLVRAPDAPGGWRADDAAQNLADYEAAADCYAFCLAHALPMGVVSRAAVPLLPMQLARSFADACAGKPSIGAVMRYLSDAQVNGLLSLWQSLNAGLLPPRCTKQWYFESFCGVSREEFERTGCALSALDGSSDVSEHLNGAVKPFDVVALMLALPSLQPLFRALPGAVHVVAGAEHLLLLSAEQTIAADAVLALLRETYHTLILHSESELSVSADAWPGGGDASPQGAVSFDAHRDDTDRAHGGAQPPSERTSAAMSSRAPSRAHAGMAPAALQGDPLGATHLAVRLSGGQRPTPARSGAPVSALRMIHVESRSPHAAAAAAKASAPPTRSGTIAAIDRALSDALSVKENASRLLICAALAVVVGTYVAMRVELALGGAGIVGRQHAYTVVVVSGLVLSLLCVVPTGQFLWSARALAFMLILLVEVTLALDLAQMIGAGVGTVVLQIGAARLVLMFLFGGHLMLSTWREWCAGQRLLDVVWRDLGFLLLVDGFVAFALFTQSALTLVRAAADFAGVVICLWPLVRKALQTRLFRLAVGGNGTREQWLAPLVGYGGASGRGAISLLEEAEATTTVVHMSEAGVRLLVAEAEDRFAEASYEEAEDEEAAARARARVARGALPWDNLNPIRPSFRANVDLVNTREAPSSSSADRLDHPAEVRVLGAPALPVASATSRGAAEMSAAAPDASVGLPAGAAGARCLRSQGSRRSHVIPLQTSATHTSPDSRWRSARVSEEASPEAGDGIAGSSVASPIGHTRFHSGGSSHTSSPLFNSAANLLHGGGSTSSHGRQQREGRPARAHTELTLQQAAGPSRSYLLPPILCASHLRPSSTDSESSPSVTPPLIGRFTRRSTLEDPAAHEPPVRTALSSAQEYGVDFFLSHAQQDDPGARAAALHRWALRVRGELTVGSPAPTVWIDVLADSEKHLTPEQQLHTRIACLARARRLVILWGEHYVSNLLCIVDVCSWLALGRSVDEVDIVPPANTQQQLHTLITRVDTFHVSQTVRAWREVHDPSSTDEVSQRLLNAISLAGAHAVNKAVTGFLPAVSHAVLELREQIDGQAAAMGEAQAAMRPMAPSAAYI